MFAPEASDYVIEYPEMVMSQLIFFEGGLRQLSVMSLDSHGAIIWYAFGVAWLNSRGVVLFLSFMCFSTVMQFLCCLHLLRASNDPPCC